MVSDPDRDAIAAEVDRVLFGQDPFAFVAHCFGFGVLLSFYQHGNRVLLEFCLAFYAIGIFSALLTWLWHLKRPQLQPPRAWLCWHAIAAVLLYGAAGMTVLLAYQSPEPNAVRLHSILLVLLAAGVYAAHYADLGNVVAPMLALLGPTLLLHVRDGTIEGAIIAVALGLFILAMSLYASHYRKLFLDAVIARLRQQSLTESLSIEKRLAEEANFSKSRFFAAANHDLRQPLHAISLLTEGLRTEEDTVRRRRKLAHLTQNVRALERLFDKVLDLAKLEAGVTQFVPQHLRLAPVLDRVEKQHRPQAAAKGLVLRVAPTPAVIFSDEVLLERVLSNLLSNAIRYTDHGAIWLGLRCAGRLDGGYLELRDSGIGIAPDQQGRVFEEFYQVPDALHPNRQGHGLGLPIVKRLCDLMGAGFTMRSAPGCGTTVRFFVPFGDPHRIDKHAAEVVEWHAWSDGQRVLCIDEAVVHDTLRALLEQWGCDTACATDELSALTLVAQGFQPDAILCDFRIGTVGGMPALQRLLGQTSRNGEITVPCIFTSSDASVTEVAAISAIGVPVLHKPINPARLRRTLQHVWRHAPTA